MSKILDSGFIIYIKKYNERSSIIKIVSENSGIVSGFLKKSSKKEDKYGIQVSNFVKFEYSYKSEEISGSVKIDNITNNFGLLVADRLCLSIFNSVISILINSINENDNIFEIYKTFEKMIFLFREGEKSLIVANYINFLFKIVAYLGININVDRCVITGAKDVFYMSPKTANCVSKAVGKKYRNKLFVIPKCFFGDFNDKNEIIKSINILHFFIEKIFLENEISHRYKNIKLLKQIVLKNI